MPSAWQVHEKYMMTSLQPHAAVQSVMTRTQHDIWIMTVCHNYFDRTDNKYHDEITGQKKVTETREWA